MFPEISRMIGCFQREAYRYRTVDLERIAVRVGPEAHGQLSAADIGVRT
jgi:hypothetical protein